MVVKTQSIIEEHYKEYLWWDLKKIYNQIEKLARQRDFGKESYDSAKYWTKEGYSHLIGLFGEVCVSLETGLKVDRSIRLDGDLGYDFIVGIWRINAKGATYFKSPDLKEFLNPKKTSDFYILVAIKNLRFVRVIGWATKDQLFSAPKKDYGKGEMHHLTIYDLADMGQLGLPKIIKRRSNEELLKVRNYLSK